MNSSQPHNALDPSQPICHFSTLTYRPADNRDERMSRRSAIRIFFILASGLWFLALPLPATTLTVPRLDNPITDEADVLSDDDLEQLEENSIEHFNATGVQIACLLIETTGDSALERATFPAADGWAGPTVERDDGILIVFAVDDREMHLARGYGIKKILPDNYAEAIADDAIAPHQNYPVAAIDRALDAVIDQTAHLEPGGKITHPPRPLGTYAALTIPLLYLFAILQVFLWRRYKKLHGSWNDAGLTTGRYFRHPVDVADAVLWALPGALVAFTFSEAGFWRPMLILWLLMALAISFATRFLEPLFYFAVGSLLLVASAGFPLYFEFFPATYDEVVKFVTATSLMGVVAATFIALYVTFDSVEEERLRSIDSGAVRKW